eukprot:TRINITY_DN93727_c0_g1_i1.p2 TRINITY_DN93727_c0_g1~~TRINITY_DN93727_c0_g1_i1.p2  ORF type:complete len:339 (-),score=46.74 TRINITY_DN93727_c0_g1_i1:1357-2373(-)
MLEFHTIPYQKTYRPASGGASCMQCCSLLITFIGPMLIIIFTGGFWIQEFTQFTIQPNVQWLNKMLLIVHGPQQNPTTHAWTSLQAGNAVLRDMLIIPHVEVLSDDSDNDGHVDYLRLKISIPHFNTFQIGAVELFALVNYTIDDPPTSFWYSPCHTGRLTLQMEAPLHIKRHSLAMSDPTHLLVEGMLELHQHRTLLCKPKLVGAEEVGMGDRQTHFGESCITSVADLQPKRLLALYSAQRNNFSTEFSVEQAIWEKRLDLPTHKTHFVLEVAVKIPQQQVVRVQSSWVSAVKWGVGAYFVIGYLLCWIMWKFRGVLMGVGLFNTLLDDNTKAKGKW